MSDIIEKIKRTIEDSLQTAQSNAHNLKDLAEDMGRTARLRLDLFQLQNSKKKKFELLGETVFPYLSQKKYDALKKHETLPILIDSINKLDEDISILKKKLASQAEQDTGVDRTKEHKELHKQITDLEKEIEARIQELKIMKESLDHEKGK